MALRCGARTPLDCLHDHIRPFLRQPRPAAADGYRALATCHADTDPSLTVSVRGGRVVWHCFARCGSDRARNALIRLGVGAACLIRPAADVASDLEQVRAVIEGKESHVRKVLLVAAILNGYDELPAGFALEGLAGSCGVSVREAYNARRATFKP